MHDLPHRFAIAAVFVVGFSSLLSLGSAGAAGAVALQHREVMLATIAATLALAPWMPSLRLPAIAAALLAKLTFIGVALVQPQAGWLAEAGQVALLLAAGAILLAEARREARWDSVVPLRQET